MAEVTDKDVRSMKDKAILELQRLRTKLASKVFDLEDKVDILIYFDEAHTLTECLVSRSGPKTLYNVLLSVLNEYRGEPLFIVFLSTNPHLANFAPPPTQANSSRAIQAGVPHAPITETPFDCNDKITVKQFAHTREETGQVHFIARFGRPLCVFPHRF